MIEKIIVDAFKLFEQDFQDGDEVIIVNDNNLLDWGTLSYDETGFTLSSRIRATHHYDWHQCVFMAKDGFPIRKIFGTFPKGIDITNKQEVIREALTLESIDALKEKISFMERNILLGGCRSQFKKIIVEFEELLQYFKNKISHPFLNYIQGDGIRGGRPSVSGIAFGCPFRIDDLISVQLFNPYGVGSKYDLTSMEETIRIVHKNGAVAQLWQLTEAFDFE